MPGPELISLTPKGHTKVDVTMTVPRDWDEEDVLVAYVAGAAEKNCTGKNNVSVCTIGGLLPRIPYNVCARSCHPNATATTAVSDSSGGAQLSSSVDLFRIGTVEANDALICSNAVCSSVTIPIEVPGLFSMTPKGHTEVNVTITERTDWDKEDVLVAYVAGGAEAKNCIQDNDTKECIIGGLLPRIPYNVCARSCHPNATATTAVSDSSGGAQLSSS
ncbi:unnamed protein product, partial [Hydatigera taeniaeformis]|uniref:Fibronectin type-III domain-containing protein n=1 Tax=Hydatigena taeniaeformis TaxID=6205 RepID=A0A0R3X720_HYDTA